MSPIRKVLEVLPVGFEALCAPDDDMVEIRLRDVVRGERKFAVALIPYDAVDARSPSTLSAFVRDVCEGLRQDMRDLSAEHGFTSVSSVWRHKCEDR